MNKVNIRKKLPYYQKDIDKAIINLLLSYDKRIKPTTIKGFVVDAIRGHAHFKEGIFSVPEWSINKGYDHFTYYVAHEMAHIISYRKYKAQNHDKDFYRVFIKICPLRLQHYELEYIKRSKLYGVKEK